MQRWTCCAAALAALFLATAPARAVTLRQLSMDELIAQSTAIVQGRVLGSYTTLLNGEVYTHVKVQVSSRWKGVSADVADIVFPGGAAGRVRQSIPGVPRLQEGQQYVLYLWTNRAGLTFVTGFQQGIFSVSQGADGQAMVQRSSVSEMMLDGNGKPVSDSPVRMPLQDMLTRVTLLTRGGTR